MKRLHTLTALVFLTVFSFALFSAMPVRVFADNHEEEAAAAATPAQGVCGDENQSFLSFPTWYKYLDKAPGSGGRCDIAVPKDAEGNTRIDQVVAPVLLAVFEIILRIGGIAAVGFIIFGGFQYLISQGEPDRTKGAKSTILNAVIGLVITLSASAIVNIIGRNIA